MATFLPLRDIPEIDITLFQRDYFDGIGFVLQDDNGLPIDLSSVTVCASIYQTTASGTSSIVTSFNVQKEEPFTNGALNLVLPFKELAPRRVWPWRRCGYGWALWTLLLTPIRLPLGGWRHRSHLCVTTGRQPKSD